MIARDRFRPALFLVAVIAVTATAGCAGWKKPEPDPQHLAQVNRQFADRYDFVLDTAKLLKTDLQTEVQGPTGVLNPGEAIQRALYHNFSLVTQSESLAIAQA